MLRHLTLAGCVFALTACLLPPAGRSPSGPDTAPDAGSIDEAPELTWSYLPVAGARCGNGTATGIGVNRHPDATTLVVYIQGGGACWETGACYVLKTSVHVEDTVQEKVVLAEAGSAALDLIFDREDVDNSFKDAHHVYVPYCTGDLHAGSKVKRYELLGQTRDLHHVGALNMQAYVDELATLEGIERVFLIGTSAGGYGALINWWRFREAFDPSVRIDVLNDSGLPVRMAWDRFGTAMAAWDTRWPDGCQDCAEDGFPALLPHYAATLPPTDRFGLLAFREDDVIANYFGLTRAQVKADVDAQLELTDERQKFFRLDGTGHVLLATPGAKTAGGVSVRDWFQRFVDDDAAWAHEGP